MKTFSYGARVAIYTTHGRKTGTVIKYEPVRHKADKKPTQMLVIKHDDGGAHYRQHPNQCRLLKKKERRRVWACARIGVPLNNPPCSGPLHTSRELAERNLLSGYEVVEFIEIRKKHGGE